MVSRGDYRSICRAGLGLRVDPRACSLFVSRPERPPAFLAGGICRPQAPSALCSDQGLLGSPEQSPRKLTASVT